jgi:hypothetical protein
MGRPVDDLTGQKIGRWKVIRRVENNKNGNSRYECECECGTIKPVDRSSLTSGESISCGCFQKEQAAERGRERWFKHGLCGTPEYEAWRGIARRTTNPNDKAYKDYGARGITMSEEWRNSFEAFYRDMGPRPGPEYTLERVDNDGPYAKWNCEWKTQREQMRNTRRNVWLTAYDRTQIITDWAKELNAHTTSILYWLDKGKSMEWIVDHFQEHPELYPKGEKHPRAKLSNANVIFIKQRAAEGMVHGEKASLARHFGVMAAAIGHIVSGIAWKSVI